MPICFRYTYIFQVTTEPVSRANAQPHTGGWSENVWSAADPVAYSARWTRWGQKRALLLPKQAAIVGFRSQKYDIQGNKLVPSGSTSGTTLFPGNPVYETDLPQVALTVTATSGVARNNSDFKLLCIPDVFMTGGEFNPTATFKTQLTNLFNEWKSHPTGMVGRDLDQPLVRVLSITAGTLAGDTNVLLDGPYPLLVAGDFLRWNNVKDDDGNPVQGSNRVVGFVPGGNTVVVRGLTGVFQPNPSGFARRDIAQYLVLNNFSWGRASIRKVGKPSQGYRGRASNR